MGKYDHWLTWDVRKCVMRHLEPIINKVMNYYDQGFDEKELVFKLFDEIVLAKDHINNCFPKNYIIDYEIGRSYQTKNHEGSHGFDIIIIIDIKTKNKIAEKVALIQAKRLKPKPPPNLDTKISDKLIDKQVRELNRFSERSGYLMFFLPKKMDLSVESSRHSAKQHGIQVLSTLEYSHIHRKPPIIRDILNGADSFLDFFLDGLIGTPEGSSKTLEMGEGETIRDRIKNSKIKRVILLDHEYVEEEFPIDDYPYFYIRMIDDKQD